MKDSDSSGCSLNLFAEENSWHYITVTPTRSDKTIEFAINVIITGKTLATSHFLTDSLILVFYLFQTVRIRRRRSTTSSPTRSTRTTSARS